MKRKIFNEISRFLFTYTEGEEVWFVGENWPVIFKADIYDCSIKNIIKIKGDRFIRSQCYWKLIKVQNKVILLPCNNNRIVIWNTDNNQFSYVYLYKDITSCVSCIKDGTTLYLTDADGITIIDIEYEKIKKYISFSSDKTFFSVMAFLKDGHILIPLLYRDEIVDFNICDSTFSVISLNCATNGFAAGVIDGTDLWLAGMNGNIIRYNYKNGKYFIYDTFPKDFSTFNYDEKGNFIEWGKGWVEGKCFKYWHDGFLLDNKIWFIPFLSDSLLYVDKKTNEIHKFSFPYEEETKCTMEMHSTVKFIFLGIYKERYIKIYSSKRELIYCIDSKTFDYTEEYFRIDQINTEEIEKEYIDLIYQKLFTEGIYETKNVSVREFLEIISGEKSSEKVCNNVNIGEYIYQKL